MESLLRMLSGSLTMLVLSRKVNERVYLDVCGGIWVTVVSVRGNTIRLGFEADKQVRIVRTELEDRNNEENAHHGTK